MGVPERAVLSPCRFDGELSQAHEETQRERLQREKLSREKDVLVAEVFGLKQLLEVSGSPSGTAPLAVAHSAVSPPRPHPDAGQRCRHRRADAAGGGAGGRAAGHLLPGIQGRGISCQGEEAAA